MRTIIAIILLVLLSGCGQKGDLYRPHSNDNTTDNTLRIN